MSADGSGVTRLTDNSAGDWRPRWSPDGQLIVFVSDRDDPDPNDDHRISNIYVMSADGSGVTRLTDNSAGDDWGPRWSPDGQLIVFVSDRDDPDPNDDHRISNIYVMSADGSGVTQLTDNSASDALPIWSPDGRWIAFISNRDGDYEIYVMNANGSGATQLTDNSAFDIPYAWSPDGRWIAFASDLDGDRELYLVRPDGSGLTKLTDNDSNDYSLHWTGP